MDRFRGGSVTFSDLSDLIFEKPSGMADTDSTPSPSIPGE